MHLQTFAPSPVLELRDVTYRRDGREIIRGVTFTVNRGEHWAMLGPNGAGKSTILGFCGAVTFPTAGTVHVLGSQLGRVELQALRRVIGHVNPRHPLRSPLTVRDVVLTGLTGTIETALRWKPSAEESARAEALIASLGLDGKASLRWPILSQGERGRALIARALICEPRLLLLDEPSTGLDIAAREQLLEAIDLLAVTHPDVASVLVTHHLEELPSSTTHALLLADGRVVSAGPAETAVSTEYVSAAFSHPIDVQYHDGRWLARAARRSPVLLQQALGGVGVAEAGGLLDVAREGAGAVRPAPVPADVQRLRARLEHGGRAAAAEAVAAIPTPLPGPGRAEAGRLAPRRDDGPDGLRAQASVAPVRGRRGGVPAAERS